MRKWASLSVFAVSITLSPPAWAQSKSGPEVEACSASGLIALKERSPTVHDLVLDPDTLQIAAADTSVGDTKIKTVVTGTAHVQGQQTDRPNHFICLIGEKGKVALTFFMNK